MSEKRIHLVLDSAGWDKALAIIYDGPEDMKGFFKNILMKLPADVQVVVAKNCHFWLPQNKDSWAFSMSTKAHQERTEWMFFDSRFMKQHPMIQTNAVLHEIAHCFLGHNKPEGVEFTELGRPTQEHLEKNEDKAIRLQRKWWSRIE